MAAGDEIREWIREIKARPPEERTECPICDWPLDKFDDGTLHCPFDGWSYPERIGPRKRTML